MCSWVKIWTKIYKRQTQLPFLKSREKNWVSGAKQGTAQAPALNATKGWAEHLTHPSGPTPGHTPTLIRNQLASPQRASKGTCYLSSLPPAASPNKALPEFLVWPLVNFY